MKLVCLGWKLNRDEHELLTNICSYMKKKLKDWEVELIDCFRHTITGANKYVAFGDSAERECKEKAYKLPTPKTIIKDKKAALIEIDKLIESTLLLQEDIEELKHLNVYVETKENVTIGMSACDINLSEDEVKYLKMLRGMLEGSKMVITKGDIRIEVE